MKPRIRRTKYKGWVCIGNGISCHGDSISAAYEEWNHMNVLIMNYLAKGIQ